MRIMGLLLAVVGMLGVSTDLSEGKRGDPHFAIVIGLLFVILHYVSRDEDG